VAIAQDIPDGLEDWWADYARSLRRRDRSEATVRVYRQSYERFWRWALTHDLSGPGDITTTIVNEWVDHERTKVAPTTVAIVWCNLRPFSSWWGKETAEPNPFAGPTSWVPAANHPR
jgi:site-specific recombinase XerD